MNKLFVLMVASFSFNALSQEVPTVEVKTVSNETVKVTHDEVEKAYKQILQLKESKQTNIQIQNQDGSVTFKNPSVKFDNQDFHVCRARDIETGLYFDNFFDGRGEEHVGINTNTMQGYCNLNGFHAVAPYLGVSNRFGGDQNTDQSLTLAAITGAFVFRHFGYVSTGAREPLLERINYDVFDKLKERRFNCDHYTEITCRNKKN